MAKQESPGRGRALYVPARKRVAFAAGVGLVAGILIGVVVKAELGALIGWDVAAVVYLVGTWRMVWPLDAAQTSAHANTEDPSRAASDLGLLIAAVASLVAVGVVIVEAGSSAGLSKGLQVGLGIASVVVSWVTVHTVNMLRYARLYYTGNGGADFHQDGPPRFSDFAYLALTVGMTFQVSDTELNSAAFRATVLRHALLSYLFGTVIISLTINLVAGLSK